MTIALRKSLQTSVPQTSFGPFRLLHALPWLILAAAMRVVAFGGGSVALPAIIVANMAVLQAFLATAQRSIEAAGGQSQIGDLGFSEQFRLSRTIELGTTDGPGAKEFYTKLFGWDVKETPMGPDFTYYIFQVGGQDVAAMYQLMEDQLKMHVPPHWMSYVSVTSADDAAAKVT